MIDEYTTECHKAVTEAAKAAQKVLREHLDMWDVRVRWRVVVELEDVNSKWVHVVEENFFKEEDDLRGDVCVEH